MPRADGLMAGLVSHCRVHALACQAGAAHDGMRCVATVWCAQISDAAHGGQVLVSHEAWTQLRGQMANAGFPVVGAHTALVALQHALVPALLLHGDYELAHYQFQARTEQKRRAASQMGGCTCLQRALRIHSVTASLAAAHRPGMYTQVHQLGLFHLTCDDNKPSWLYSVSDSLTRELGRRFPAPRKLTQVGAPAEPPGAWGGCCWCRRCVAQACIITCTGNGHAVVTSHADGASWPARAAQLSTGLPLA